MKGFHILIDDIRNNYKGIIIVILYLIITHLLFGYVCPLRLLTGLPCPGCGLTRAGISMILFDFNKVFYYNPIIIPIALIIIYCVFMRYILGRRILYFNILVIGVLSMLFIYYLYRMITLFPYHKPMEYYKDNFLSPVYNFVRQLRISKIV